MDQVDVIVSFELSDEVSEASRFSLAVQLEELILKCLESGELAIPDGTIEDAEVVYDETPYV